MSEANDTASLNRMIGNIQGEIKHLSEQGKAQSDKLDKLLEDRGRVFEAARDIAELKLKQIDLEGRMAKLELNASAIKGKIAVVMGLGGVVIPAVMAALINWITKG